MNLYKMLAVVMVVVVAAVVADGQSTPDCATKLTPCFPYLNSTTPPKECCDPLLDAVANDLQCLCNLYGQPDLLPSLGVNITQAQLLPRYCGHPGDLGACTGTQGPSSAPPPPGVPGDNGVGKISGSAFVLVASMAALLF